MKTRDYLSALRRHVWLVVTLVLLITVPVAALFLLRLDYYDATTRIEIGGPSISAEDQSTAAADPVDYNTSLQFLTSPALMREVIQSLDLESDMTYRRHVEVSGRLLRRILRLASLRPIDLEIEGVSVGGEGSTFTEADLAERKRVAPLVEDLQNRLTIAPVMETRSVVKDTRLLDLTFRHPNPVVAAKIVNRISDLFIAAKLEEKQAAIATIQESLALRANQLVQEIRASEQRVSTLQERSQILPQDDGRDIGVERLAILSRQLLDAESERKQTETNYQSALAPDAARQIAEENSRNILNDATLRLADLRARRAQMLVGATEAWPEVQEIDQQIRSLEEDMRQIQGRALSTALSSLGTKFGQAQAREATLRTAFEAQKQLVLLQGSATGDIELVDQQIAASRALLDETLRKLGSSSNDSLQNAAAIHVVEYSAIPDPSEPVGPWRLAYIGGAFLISLIGGSIVAIVRESFDQKVRTLFDVQTALPYGDQVTLIRAALFRLPKPKRASETQLELSQPYSVHSNNQIPISHYTQTFMEDFRRLRSALLNPSGARAPKVILVTSAARGEGTTTNAANLALSLAHSGARVLLIDANLPHAAVHRVFGIPNTYGLSTWLTGDFADADPQTLISQVPGTGLDVMPAGPDGPQSVDLVGSSRMPLLLEKVETQYSYIILDTSAVSVSANGVVLASIVDAVVLVVRAEKTTRESMLQTYQALQQVGAHMIHVVLNHIPKRFSNIVFPRNVTVRVSPNMPRKARAKSATGTS